MNGKCKRGKRGGDANRDREEEEEEGEGEEKGLGKRGGRMRKTEQAAAWSVKLLKADNVYDEIHISLTSIFSISKCI